MRTNETLILSTLTSGEKYGLAIVDAIDNMVGKGLSLGSLYTTLSRMEAKGLVKSRWGETTVARGGARRRYYKLTSIGKKALYNEGGES